MKINDITEKPKIDFPCEWSYKIFGTDKNKLENAISEVLKQNPYQIVKATKSSKGNYISLTIKLIIKNQSELDDFYHKFSAQKDIKIVL
jgi:uncharacterized protein